MDQLVVMNYFNEDENGTSQKTWAEFAGQLRSKYPNVQVVLGQGTWLNSTANTLTQLERERDYVDGWTLYANDKVPADLWAQLPKTTPTPEPE